MNRKACEVVHGSAIVWFRCVNRRRNKTSPRGDSKGFLELFSPEGRDADGEK